MTASEDRTAKIWDVKSGQLLLTLGGQPAEYPAAAWGPMVRLMITGNYVSMAAFSPDGRYLLANSYPTSPSSVWDVASGTRFDGLLDLDFSAARTTRVAFSPDSTRFVAVTKYRYLAVGNIPAQEPTGKKAERQLQIACFAGDHLPAYVRDRGWRVNRVGAGPNLNWAGFAPDGQRLVVAGTSARFAACGCASKCVSPEMKPACLGLLGRL